MIEQVGKFVITKNLDREYYRQDAYYAAVVQERVNDLCTFYDYLHSDGIVRGSTRNVSNGKFTGYFSTIEEVKQAIELYNQLNAK